MFFSNKKIHPYTSDYKIARYRFLAVVAFKNHNFNISFR